MQLTIALLAVLALQTSAMRQGKTSSKLVEDLAEPTGIDFNQAIGCSAKGISAIKTGLGSDPDEWAGWGLAVSGNGLMAEAAAAGTLRALSENNILEELTTISSVSGGSWFTTQFGFSEAYYEGVVNLSTPIDEWYTSYQGQAMSGMMSATSPRWESMISAMYKGFDKGLLDVPAVSTNRKGKGNNADLLFCTNLNGESLLSDNSTKVQLSSGKGKAFYTNPAFWAVPTSGSASWHVPGVDLDAATWAAGDKSTTNASQILPTPTVTKIGAMSSAANGITSNPELSNLFEPKQGYSTMFGSYLNPDNGVCTTPGENCSFPSMMAIDGCYSDNLGFALNVGYLQKKFPGKKLRLMAVSSLVCDRTADPTCIDGVKGSAFRSFFADSPYPTVEGWLPAIVPGPNRTIFAESLTDQQVLGQQTGYGGMTFVTGTFTTIQNDFFGVAAGTTVSIIVLNVNGPQYLQPAGPGVPAGGMEGLSSVAANAYYSFKALLKAYTVNQKVTSRSAFLYYQTVQTAVPSTVTREDIEKDHRCCCEHSGGGCLWYPEEKLINRKEGKRGSCPRLWAPDSGVGAKCVSSTLCLLDSHCTQTEHSPGECDITEDPQAYFSGPRLSEPECTAESPVWR